MFLFAASVSSFSRVQIAFSTNDYPMSHGFVFFLSAWILATIRDRGTERDNELVISSRSSLPASWSRVENAYMCVLVGVVIK